MCIKKTPYTYYNFQEHNGRDFSSYFDNERVKISYTRSWTSKKRAEIVGPNKPNLFESLDVGGKKVNFHSSVTIYFD